MTWKTTLLVLFAIAALTNLLIAKTSMKNKTATVFSCAGLIAMVAVCAVSNWRSLNDADFNSPWLDSPYDKINDMDICRIQGKIILCNMEILYPNL